MILELNSEYRALVNKILKYEWNSPPIISRGRALDTTALPGFISVTDTHVNGLITYKIEKSECEIVTLNSFEENKGIGTALINAVLSIAKERQCNRIWLVTTNDDINAIRFYQKKGFDLVAVHINAIDVSREMKPSIPLIGMDGIPIKHELEFEIKL